MKKDAYTVPEGYFEKFSADMDGKLRSERHRRLAFRGIAAGLGLTAALLLFAPDFSHPGEMLSESECIAETLDLYESDIFLRNFDFE